jgi:DNA recombination protein RmuC
MIFLEIGIGVVVGLVVGWLVASKNNLGKLGQLEGELTAVRQQAQGQSGQIQERGQKIEEMNQSLSEGQRQIGSLTQQIADQQRAMEEQKKLLDQAQQKLQDTFKALASDTLKASKEDFLQLAKESLTTLLTQAKGDMGKHKEQIDGLVKPLQEALTNYQKNLQEMEKNYKQDYGSLSKHLEEMGKTHQALNTKTTELATALKNPQVGGRWGELTLRRSAELAGMSEFCDFEEQTSSTTESGKLRPDMIVHLPGGRLIAVDSKLSYQSYIDAVNATDPAMRMATLKKYSQAVRQHVQGLSSKSYWEQFQSHSVDLVVLFLPGECFFSAAVLEDKELIEYAMSNRVVLASPTTLISLLRAVSFGWRQEKLAENAERIRELGQEFFDRIVNFIDPLTEVSTHLNRAVKSFNAAVGSLETRLIPSAKKFNELGIGEESKIPGLSTVDITARELPSVTGLEGK